MTSHYAVLGLQQDASQQQIRDAYRKLALQHHPDKKQQLQLQEQTQTNDQIDFDRVLEAYNTLKEPESRKQYDKTLHGTFERHLLVVSMNATDSR